MLEDLKPRVNRLLAKLPENKLVCSTGGNVSARYPDSGIMVIKPRVFLMKIYRQMRLLWLMVEVKELKVNLNLPQILLVTSIFIKKCLK